MSRLRAVLVDDEAPARKRLRDLLAGTADVELVAECEDGPSAVDAIRTQAPHLLFLDVQMPEMDGFQVLEAVGAEAVPAVVFVTAYDRHAVAAFDLHAVDYLLKPFTRARFDDTLDRVRRALLDRPEALLARVEDVLAGRRPGARLPVPTDTGTRLLDPASIGWIEADGNYAVVHAEGRAYRIRRTLKALLERLEPSGFVRIHHSYLVNADHIRELQPWSHGELAVVLRDGTSLVSSRTYGAELKALLDA